MFIRPKKGSSNLEKLWEICHRMKHTYFVEGMTCSGCQHTVERLLESVSGVKNLEVNLEDGTATLEMDNHIPFTTLAAALEHTHYSLQESEPMASNDASDTQAEVPPGSTFYCPMHCEGEKTYAEPGSCPVCGMDLVPQLQLRQNQQQWTCPMHPEIVESRPGSCPICGMELRPIESDISAEDKSVQELSHKFWLSVAFSLPIFLIAMSESISGNPLYTWLSQKSWNWVQFVLSLPVVFYTTWMFFERAWRSVRTWNLNMFTLIGLGAGVAWIFSVFGLLFPDFFPAQFKSDTDTVHVYFEAATVILTLVLLGQLLEARAHSRTNQAVKALLQLAPNQAYKIVNDTEVLVPLDEIRVGDVLRVKPGDKIPVDGVVTEGNASIDESMITGEPIPVDKMEGDVITSGTINTNRTFLMQAQKIGADTLLAQIIDMVNQASRSRAPIQKLADQISAYFVPIVVLIAVVTFIVWAWIGPQPVYVYALVNAIAVLIIACPCALGLATPMSVMVGVGKGARHGVLIKNAEALQKMSSIDTLVIDKTGTITVGAPSVEKVLQDNSDWDEKEILSLMISLNRMSEHPLAQAAVQYGEERKVPNLPVDDFKANPGAGVEGKVDGRSVVVGNEKMMQRAEVALSENLLRQSEKYRQEGKTVSFIAVQNQLAGRIVIEDKIKSTSQKAIRSLQQAGVEIIMLTGDHPLSAKAVADQVGVDDFQAQMLPQDKLAYIKKLQAEGKSVVMAGDGINDAPALAQSEVGIAMGTGTDVAIESAEITLVKGDLQGVVKARNLSKAVMRNIRQNLFFALVYNTLGVPIAAGVLYPFFGVLLSPMIAALAMSFSSVSVIGNSLRLRSISL